ncbi:MAG: hypothetical protein ACPIOQ_00815 [Promethearchaeia archaeon]
MSWRRGRRGVACAWLGLLVALREAIPKPSSYESSPFANVVVRVEFARVSEFFCFPVDD